ncbi:MAG TPA: hypothetical protein VGD40_02065 [Chryseosolibacter sp.]
MYKCFFVLLALATACNDLKRSEEEFPVKTTSDWITYEGRVPVTDKQNLYMEIAMLPGNAGEGYYQLDEFLETPTDVSKIGSFKGVYSSFSTPSGELEIHFQNSSYPEGITYRYPSLDGKRIREQEYRVRDLVLRKEGDDKLIAVDNANQPISLDERHNLSKRTSHLFTIEGKFAHVGDSSVFYETNTKQVWPLSRQGAYELATRQYYQLSDVKNEGIYLKGVGFSVREVDERGHRKEALVIKSIIAMTSSPISE